ncbi:MAG: class I SAM-dependent methyltransferase [Dehalococcoidales bacterium]|jgi:cephalosporin hydroxylase
MKLDNNVTGCLSPIEGTMISSLYRECSPENCAVNIGCYKGKSLRYMICEMDHWYWEPPKIYGIDIKIKQELKNAFVINHVTLIENSSTNMETLSQIREPIEFLFIDGDHSYTGCMNDLMLYWPKIVSGGVVMVHDVFDTSGKICEPDVGEAFKYFVEMNKDKLVPDDWYLGPVHRVDSSAIIQKI